MRVGTGQSGWMGWQLGIWVWARWMVMCDVGRVAISLDVQDFPDLVGNLVHKKAWEPGVWMEISRWKRLGRLDMVRGIII